MIRTAETIGLGGGFGTHNGKKIESYLNILYVSMIYRRVCETGRVYYGSTTKTLERRIQSGWYKCSCKDFKNAIIDVMEIVENEEDLKKRENWYINNLPCVNQYNALGLNKENEKKTLKKYRINNKEKIQKTANEYFKNYQKNNKEKIRKIRKKHFKKALEEERFKCETCNMCFRDNYSLQRHFKSKKHLNSLNK